MGTPEFAVPSLDILVKSSYQVVAVVTAPDKPAGRGRKISHSAVKEYAIEQQIPLLQPTNLKDPEFVKELKSYQADLQIVVAFRMLPAIVWQIPVEGTFNLHASILPQYRGAAPINWAIINGETETGITTFFIDEKIDTGRIILSDKVMIGSCETAGELHDRLMIKGSELVLRTVDAIADNLLKLKSQENLGSNQLKSAPKIFKEDTRINWEKPRQEVFNLIRGLSPYPGAYTQLINLENESWVLKIYKAKLIEAEQMEKPNVSFGDLITDGKAFIYLVCADGFIAVEEIQLEGKRKMHVSEFLRGFSITSKWKVGN